MQDLQSTNSRHYSQHRRSFFFPFVRYSASPRLLPSRGPKTGTLEEQRSTTLVPQAALRSLLH